MSIVWVFFKLPALGIEPLTRGLQVECPKTRKNLITRPELYLYTTGDSLTGLMLLSVDSAPMKFMNEGHATDYKKEIF
jgi:hypothetical protein